MADQLLDMLGVTQPDATAAAPGAMATQAAADPAPNSDPLLAALGVAAPAPASGSIPIIDATNRPMTPEEQASHPVINIAGTSADQPQQSGQPSSLGALGASLGHGFGSTVLGAQQLLGHGLQSMGANNVGGWLVNDANQGIKNLDSQMAPYQAAHPVVSGVGDVAGNVVATAPLALLAPEMAGASMGSKALTGGLLGASTGALAPVQNDTGANYWGDKLGQIATGGAAGAVAAPVTSLLGNMVSGAQGAAQRKLADMGITMTPGQILGGGFAKTEDKLTSVPIVGDLIKNAQRRSIDDFNQATYNQVLGPLGQTYSGPIGNEGVSAVKQTISNAYDNALGKMHFNANDPAFQSEIGNLTNMANALPPAQRNQFINVLQTQINGKLGPQGTFDGQTLKGVQAELGKIAKGYLGDPSFDNRQLGAAVNEIRAAVDRSITRYNPADAVQGLNNANSAYANFVRLRSAASSQGAMNNGGIFTPAQLSNAVKAGDKSVGKSATATGNALMQDFAVPAQGVLGSKYPDSGTAGRSALMAGIGGLGAVLTGHGIPMSAAIPGAIGGGLLAAPYTSLGQRITQGLLMNRPAAAKAIGSAIERFGTPISSLLVPSTLQAAQR